ncbi:MAG: type IV pilin [Halobacteriaceae archaeon]
MSRATVSQSQVLGLTIAVILAAATGGLLLDTIPDSGLDTGRVTVTATAAANGTITLVHRGGPVLDVRSLRVTITVDGQALRYQPPVPFFAADGFRGGPTGPFNTAADPRWAPGERASLTVADTNNPTVAPGATVVVRLYADGRLIGVARASVTGRASSRDERRGRPVPGTVDTVGDVGEPGR